MTIAEPRSLRSPLYQIAQQINLMTTLRAAKSRRSASATFWASDVVGAGNSTVASVTFGLSSPLMPRKKGIAPMKQAMFGKGRDWDEKINISMESNLESARI